MVLGEHLLPLIMNFTASDLKTIELLNLINQANPPACLEETQLYLDTPIFLHEIITDLKITMSECETYSDTLMTIFTFTEIRHCNS